MVFWTIVRWITISNGYDFLSANQKEIIMRKLFFKMAGCVVLCFMFFLISEENIFAQDKPEPRDKIREFARKLEVFPVDIIASHRKGPIVDRRRWSNWGVPYEVSFEQYVVFFEFKNYVQDLSLEEFVKIVDYIEEASFREKALILTSIFIFEWLHRERPIGTYRLPVTNKNLSRLLPYQKEYLFISSKYWDNWSELLEKYSKDENIAFPAIKEEDTLLQKNWEKDREKVKEKLKELGTKNGIKIERNQYEYIIHNGHELSSISFEFGSYDNFRKNFSPSDRIHLDAIFEYLMILPEGLSGLPSGIAPVNGNSSKTPKTLGDIATQLLMSRLPYRGKGK
jgi:hypothetical protein